MYSVQVNYIKVGVETNHRNFHTAILALKRGEVDYLILHIDAHQSVNHSIVRRIKKRFPKRLWFTLLSRTQLLSKQIPVEELFKQMERYTHGLGFSVV